MDRTDSRSSDPASAAVVGAVADALGIHPLEVTPPLYDVVDPDALDSLFHATVGRVSFEYGDVTVHVDHDGTESVVTAEAVESPTRPQ